MLSRWGGSERGGGQALCRGLQQGDLVTTRTPAFLSCREGTALDMAAPDGVLFVVTRNELILDEPQDDEVGFDSLLDALRTIEIGPDDQAKKLAEEVERHALWPAAIKEYELLLRSFIKSEEEDVCEEAKEDLEKSAEGGRESDELTDALKAFVALTRRRRKRVELFYTTLMKFLNEYSDAIEDFAVAEPMLKGSQLCHKIQVRKILRRI
eukprot:745836-Hanusia_phi.AAC.2